MALGSNGFSRKSTAPSFIASTARLALPYAVSMTTGNLGLMPRR